MAAILDLLQQITDDNLRNRLQQEFDAIKKKKKFGLVWEDHIPESTLLPEEPISVNSMVARKKGETKCLYLIKSIVDNVAQCVMLSDNTTEESIPVADLSVATRFGEPIYPYLKSLDKVCRAENSSLWHTLIEADNYHALQLLDYLYRDKVDCIYIDPPYNSGARDWKYNNDYVDSADVYRHSKWLSMMEKRLQLAKRLLNHNCSVLILTIDEKEYLHIGCLLESLFPSCNIQMVTSVISGKGVSRDGQFSRVEEYIFIVTIGSMQVLQLEKNMLQEDTESSNNPIDFLGFRRRNKGNFRTSRPNQFYPVIVDNNDGHIVDIGDAITPEVNRADVSIPNGCTGLWPLDPSGQEKIWSLVPESARILLAKGCLKVVNWKKDSLTGSVKYLASGTVEKIDNGTIVIDERDEYGAIVSGHFEKNDSETARPRRVWYQSSHNASSFGTLLIKKFLNTKRFDFPKSLYAVHDTIRFFVADKPNALIVDFFAGSGTTLHAVNLLNKEDNGNRRCIMVTNNEVSESEANEMSANGLRPGDEEWDKLGIARYVTWPRTKCSIEGVNVDGIPVKGDYMTYLTEDRPVKRIIKQLLFTPPKEKSSKEAKKQIVALLNKPNLAQNLVTDDCPYILTDDCSTSILFDDMKVTEWLEQLEDYIHIKEFYVLTQNNKLFRQVKYEIEQLFGEYTEKQPVSFPMADGFEANVEFFKLGFLNKNVIALGKALNEILPLLWMKAGCKGPRPSIAANESHDMYIWKDNEFALLINEYAFEEFVRQITDQKKHIKNIFIVTDSERAFMQMSAQMPDFSVYQLYRDYLDNFRININRK